MLEQLISFETAKLAKEKAFPFIDDYFFNWYNEKGELCCVEFPGDESLSDYFNDIKLKNGDKYSAINIDDNIPIVSYDYDKYIAPTQSLLQKFIRETRGVHIEIHRNASGYYWSMCKADGGTDLGWSDISGPNDGGVWNSFEGALENALQVQLSYDLPNDITIIKHWGNYVEFALKSK